MARKAIGPTGSRRRRWLFLMCLVATIGAGVFFIPSALGSAPETAGQVELDKNATDDLTVSHLGALKSQVNSTTATSIDVCERTPTLPFDPALPPAVGTHILIDAEEMEITEVGDPSTKTGGCGFTDPADTVEDVRTYTVTRGVNGSTAATHPGGADVSALIPDTKAGTDWDEIYAEYQAHSSDENPCAAISGSVACIWLGDEPGVSAFTQGSSDTLDITGWHWTDMGVPDADEILHAYAIKFSNSDQFLYFGADRYAVNGAKDMGFWFFKSPVHMDSATGTFVDDEGQPAAHQIGDILLLGTFTQGGAVTDIRVYSWVGSGGSDGSLDSGGAFGDCVPGSASDNGCNTVNGTTINSPWAYQGKGSTAAADVVYGGGFMEGGVDLGALGLEGCFASFMAETRSSPSLTAAQKDFTLGRFESCSSELTTSPANGSGSNLTDSGEGTSLPDIQIGTGSAGVDVTDNATLNIGGTTNWSGTLDFYLCGPITSGTCDSGGVKIDSQSVDQSDSQPITSASANLTAIGRYCWRGEFTSSTDGVPDGSDSSSGECFEVLPVTPTLSTTAWSTDGSDTDPGEAQTDDVSFGTALYDKASLSGTAYEPGTNGGKGIDDVQTGYTTINADDGEAADGKITFTLVGPDTDTLVCSTATPSTGSPQANNPEDVDVDGDDDYFTSGFTPDSAGDFHWIASYGGSTSGNTGATSHNTACDETGEDVTVLQLQPTMDTAQTFIPNDSATITVDAGAGDLDGSVSFYLWEDDSTCDSGDTSMADQSFEDIAVSATDAASGTISDTASTSNTTTYDADHDFYWIVVFSSNNGAHKDITGTCGNEHSSITIVNGSTEPSS